MPRSSPLTLLAALALGAVAATAVAAPSAAATAHNSQAGSEGPNSDSCAPTPYFREGGCLSAAVQDDRRHPFNASANPSRSGPRPTRPAD